MKPVWSIRHALLGVFIVLCLFSGLVSAISTNSGFVEDDCITVPLEKVEEIRYTLSAASTAGCPVYSQEEPELDEEGWGTTELGAKDIGSDIYYEEGSQAAHWICYPDAIWKACKNTTLPADWHLEAYQFYEGGNGNAKVFALPKGSHLLPPGEAFATETEDDSTRENIWFWPWPPAMTTADQDIMSHIIGDDTPLSYLEASLLSRELNEVGAAWHGISWGVTSIINSTNDFDEMDWEEPVPAHMDPVVCCSEKTCSVTFYTHTALHEETITRNVDTYKRGSYNATTESIILATGKGGFQF